MRGVEVVLDAVVGATGKFFGNVSPLIAQLLVQIKNLLLFCLVDGCLIDVGVQVVGPSRTRANTEHGAERDE